MFENISIIAWITLFLISVESYLRANKVWKRKHKKDVAESVSLLAQGVGIITLSFYATSSIIDQSFNGMVSSLIWLSMTILMVLVGSGLWVTDIRSSNFWKKLKLYLMKETSELGNLANAFTNPNEREHIRAIILKVALLDNQINDKEKEVLETVMTQWDDAIDYEVLQKESLKYNVSEIHNILSDLNQAISHYLSNSPAIDQVSKLADLIQLLIHNNGTQSDDQKLMATEVLEQLNAYITNAGIQNQFCVIVLPNPHSSIEALKSLHPELEVINTSTFSHLIKKGLHTQKMADIYKGVYSKHDCTCYVTIV